VENSQIIYQPKNFGIYDIESMKVLEGIYAFNFAKYANIENDKAFIIKNGRRPNKIELNYQKRLNNGEHAPHNAYFFNWYSYSAQNVMLEYPTIIQSTKTIKEIAEHTFGHKLKEDDIHTVCKLTRNKTYDLNKAYYGVNTWQLMSVVASLNYLDVHKNSKSISLLFNKIYKRKPNNTEIEICKTLKLTTPEEIENEIESYITVQGKTVIEKFNRRNRKN
jgi:hypothetical protein